jgi:RNA-directed DNA polymerase
VKYYIRYCDDFVILSENRKWLEEKIIEINKFLNMRLRLKLHLSKIFIKTLASGIDFLGWVHFPDHRVLRTTTKRRVIKRITKTKTLETLNSYLGLLRYGNTYKLQHKIFPDF